MLWRFSFASTSTLDALLSRETPPSLEEVMDEQDVLAECKAQNNKLVAYLSREDVMKSLLQWVVSGLDELDQEASEAHIASFDHAVSSPELYPSYRASAVTGAGPNSPPLTSGKLGEEILEDTRPEAFRPSDGLDRQQSRDELRSRYPQIATEILTSELWTITETTMASRDALLTPFWDAVLPDKAAEEFNDRSERERARDEFWSDNDEERDRKREVIRGMWVRVNGTLMAKRTTEMIRFIQSLPNIVDRMVASISSPSVQDMIIRIVSSEEAGVSGVIDWLATESLIPRLIALLSPTHPTTMHGIAAESLKTIITLCAPSPFNPHGGNAMEQQGQQAPGTRDNRLIRELVSEKSIGVMVKYMFEDLELTDRDWKGAGEPSDPFIVHPLPSISSATSSLSHICNILVELIRRNNSDFSEPHLFHTMRNRLMSMRIQNENEEDERKRMETAMGDFSEKMGIVHLGSLLTLLSEKFVQLHRYLLRPRSQARAASASNPKPLTVERFRIVELYAELLHSSNMSILNRAPGTGPAYSSEGILSGGLAGLEALGEAIEGDRVGEETEEQVTQARELPVSSGSTDCSLTGSEEVESDELEDMDETPSQSPAAAETLDPPAPSQADVARLRDVMSMERPASESVKAVAATTIAPSISEYENEKDQLPPGDRLKQIYIQHRVLPSVVDLFFEYPNNDFMHHVVYDLLQQILNGRLGPGLNRELVIELICGAKLIERLLDAQRLNDKLTARPKTPRLAYMGHIILIAEEIVKFLARCPPELYACIKHSFVMTEWESFVEGSLRETKARDTRPLAGGKPMPVVAPNEIHPIVSEDSSDDEEEAKIGEPLTRTVAADGFAMRSGLDPEGEESWGRSIRHVDSSDEDEDDADWLRPSANGRRGSDDDFGAFHARPQNDGSDDDEAWGTFNTASPSRSPDASDNPFGDDHFAPTRQVPLTPHDWASEFDRAFTSSEPGSSWSAETAPAIVVPNLDENDEPSTPGSTWSFTGDDEGEDLPPTTSPTLPHDPILGRSRSPTIPPVSAISPASTISPVSVLRETPPSSLAEPSPIPSRLPSVTNFETMRPEELPRHGEPISTPDRALLAASTQDAPLGPGVTSDTHVTRGGMLEKDINGSKITVPADEVIRGAAMERKGEDG